MRSFAQRGLIDSDDLKYDWVIDVVVVVLLRPFGFPSSSIKMFPGRLTSASRLISRLSALSELSFDRLNCVINHVSLGGNLS